MRHITEFKLTFKLHDKEKDTYSWAKMEGEKLHEALEGMLDKKFYRWTEEEVDTIKRFFNFIYIPPQPKNDKTDPILYRGNLPNGMCYEIRKSQVKLDKDGFLLTKPFWKKGTLDLGNVRKHHGEEV